MAGRIFGRNVFGPRIFGRVFGGAGATSTTVLGWLTFYQAPLKRLNVPLGFHQTTSWAQPNLPLYNSAISRQGDFQPPAWTKQSYQYTSWQGNTNWSVQAVDIYNAAISGWKSGSGVLGLPNKTTRSVRDTVFDNGWIGRNVPAVPLADIAYIAAITPDKGGYTLALRPKNPYLTYEWSAQSGWQWSSNVLPLLLAGVAAFTNESQQEYTLRERRKAPYMYEWSAQSGWITKALDAILAASWPAIAGLAQAEYTLRGRERGAYLPAWDAEQGWLYTAKQTVVELTYPAFANQQLREYTLAGRAKLVLSLLEWAGAMGWVNEPSYVDITPMIAPQTSQRLGFIPTKLIDYVVLYGQPRTIRAVPVPIEPEVGEVNRIITLGSVTNTGR
jgi:hypothetical protein